MIKRIYETITGFVPVKNVIWGFSLWIVGFGLYFIIDRFNRWVSPEWKKEIFQKEDEQDF